MDLPLGSKEPSSFDSPTFNLDLSIRVDQPVGSMSISPCGRDVVLASREGLHIIDLDSPYSRPRHLHHTIPWEVADVQWSPFAARDYWVVSTSNQRALVWNLSKSTSEAGIEHELHAHTRAITDINFSAHSPDILATCSVDSFVHCWDLRHPAKPALSFSDWYAGATQVKWNRQDPHIIASSHDRFLRIWDDRKGAYPLRSIEAHRTKIYGVDWNRTRKTGVVTCSLDETIKFWDYSDSEDTPERVIDTGFPVWRARHAPFGWGLLAMPQRGNNDLFLYDRRLSEQSAQDVPVAPVHRFIGHQDPVKEFLWRSRGGVTEGIDNRDFQLVSWGTDHDLRLHRVNEKVLEAVGYFKGNQIRKNLNITRKNAIYKTFRDENLPPDQKQRAESVKSPSIVADQRLGGMLRGALRAGMDNTASISSPIRDQGVFMTAQTGIEGAVNKKKDVNPITWMKGIRIGKGENLGLFSRYGGFHQRSTSIASNLQNTRNWDTPESLGDEITHVGAKFSKVAFDRVNIQKRSATMAMDGPWGADGKIIYVKVDVNFPTDYPESSSPLLKVEKTTSLSNETLNKLIKELQIIADAYLSKKKGSLEAILHYLLGERSLEDITTLLAQQDDDDYDYHMNERLGASSSEDDDDIGDASGFLSQDMEISSIGFLASTNRNANVPLPKACGAVWAQNGKLVCFFPPKEEEPKSVLADLYLKERARGSKSLKIFGAFGRLGVNLTGNKNKISSIEGVIEEGYVSDDDLFTSSSSSASSSIDDGTLPTYLRRIWRNPLRRTTRHSRPHSVDRSQRSGGTGTNLESARNVPTKPKTIISIHVLDDLIPSKKYLAEEYAIYGDGPEICEHNAKVARNHGANELADVWELARLILYNEVPLETLEQSLRKEPVLIIARQVVERGRRRDSGLDLAFDTQTSRPNPSPCGRVKWGKHPFGSVWLIKALFDYFEQIADIQMLAMLSCVFSEPSAREGVSHTMMHLQQRDTPMSMKSPGFSLEYFPSDEVAWSLYHHTLNPSTPRAPHTPIAIVGSNGSSNGAWGSDPITSYSTGTTPPFRIPPALGSAATQSFSSSPEQHPIRRTHSGLASNFTAGFSRPFSMTANSSPPINTGAKRPSPGESILANLASGGVSWGGNTIFGSVIKEDISSAISHVYYSSDEGEEEEPPKVAKTSVKVTMKNQNLFDEEGYVSAPLLNPAQSLLYMAYRENYALMLHSWDLQQARLEILKFNGMKNYYPSFNASPEERKIENSANLIMEFSQPEFVATNYAIRFESSWSGLHLEGHRSNCGTKLCKIGLHRGPRGTARPAHKCRNCLGKQPCVVCGKAAGGLLVPCLECGHVYHNSCCPEWFANENLYCPTGCGCKCAEIALPFTSKTPTKDVGSSLSQPQDGFRATGIGNILLTQIDRTSVPPTTSKNRPRPAKALHNRHIDCQAVERDLLFEQRGRLSHDGTVPAIEAPVSQDGAVLEGLDLPKRIRCFLGGALVDDQTCGTRVLEEDKSGETLRPSPKRAKLGDASPQLAVHSVCDRFLSIGRLSTCFRRVVHSQYDIVSNNDQQNYAERQTTHNHNMTILVEPGREARNNRGYDGHLRSESSSNRQARESPYESPETFTSRTPAGTESRDSNVRNTRNSGAHRHSTHQSSRNIRPSTSSAATSRHETARVASMYGTSTYGHDASRYGGESYYEGEYPDYGYDFESVGRPIDNRSEYPSHSASGQQSRGANVSTELDSDTETLVPSDSITEAPLQGRYHSPREYPHPAASTAGRRTSSYQQRPSSSAGPQSTACQSRHEFSASYHPGSRASYHPKTGSRRPDSMMEPPSRVSGSRRRADSSAGVPRASGYGGEWDRYITQDYERYESRRGVLERFRNEDGSWSNFADFDPSDIED
ncbi:MAG: hypothetical protein M1829_003678 [Trizodia sp. TS-e1964]|nr:MAG: hypothetical protein M1829_003678 [Trizodia sp. TS-e1964]